jgi:hypothetical protein
MDERNEGMYDSQDQLILEALLNPVSECFLSFQGENTTKLNRITFLAYEYVGSNTLLVKESSWAEY